MTTRTSNHYKAELHKGNINYSTDVFKVILMASGFIFDPDTHATLVIEQDTLYESLVYRDRGISMYKSLSESAKDETGRINVTNFKSAKESYKIRIHPKLNEFYMRVRETLK